MIQVHELKGFKCLTTWRTLSKKDSYKGSGKHLVLTNKEKSETNSILRINGTYFHITLTEPEKDINMLDFLCVHLYNLNSVIPNIKQCLNYHPEYTSFYVLLREDDYEEIYLNKVYVKPIPEKELEFLNYYSKFETINNSFVQLK